MPFEKYLAKEALRGALDRDMPHSVPIPTDDPNFLAGAQIYKANRAVCHGLPGKPQTAIAKGMFPKPPELLHGKGVTDDEPGETYLEGGAWNPIDRYARLQGQPLRHAGLAGEYFASPRRPFAGFGQNSSKQPVAGRICSRTRG